MSSEKEIVRHFTATAFVVHAGRTLLIWHRKLGMWLPPGGHIEPNEDPPQAALREAEEESGLRVEIVNAKTYPFSVPRPIPAPVVILVEDILIPGDYHQHIDHIYFTRALEPPEREDLCPAGPCVWVGLEELARPLSLTTAGGDPVEVAEDVRHLGAESIRAAAQALN